MIHYRIKYPIRFLVISLLFAGIFACAPRTVQKNPLEQPSSPTQILSLTTQEDADRFYIQVNASQMLTFTSVKQPSPLAVIFYFPETIIGTSKDEYDIDNDTVGTVRFSKMKAEALASRMEISLKRDVPYEVARNGNELQISFNRSIQAASAPPEEKRKPEETAPVESGEQSPVAARVFKSLSTQTLENGVQITVKADGMIKDYHSFAVDSPARIVFDMFNLKSSQKNEKALSIDSQWVERIRYYGYPDRFRVVVETNKSYLHSYTALPADDGLIIRITGSGETVSKAGGTSHEKAAESEPAAGGGDADAGKIIAVRKSSDPAGVNRIDFSSQSKGKSAIIIGTTRPVQYDVKKISDKKLQLQLFNTQLPDYRRRPLITTRFDSAVDRITPFYSEDKKNTALIFIELRESVPYLVEQTGDVLEIRFEASSIPPRPVEQAELPKWQQAMAEDARRETVPEPGGSRSEQKPDPAASPPASDPPAAAEIAMTPGKLKKEYTGQKIALDFYETDIKNVFRILREVSGKNFAVDPNVTGKVTISLADPVPWDAVLDLILGMNGLAKVEEAGIIRIAQRNTIAAESAALQAAAAAQLKAKDQEKALEPLKTVYIPINYVNAEADVLPHLVLTPDRGAATVDARNNQIILTDTADMIEKARKTIQEIDQVTPQVLIEGRIVEASNSFSRDLGAQFSVQINDILTKELGNGIIPEGKTDLNMSATNPPDRALGQIGFDFTKLTGTPLKISATLLAAESEGQIKIISSPKVLTLDNRTARIRQGTQVPIPRLDDAGNTVIDYKDVDLELEVTPHVTPDKRISMEIKITNNDIGPEMNGQTSFTTKEATTELLVSDGETVVIGGIRKSRRDESESGVPGLMKVPMLGWLFKSQLKHEEMQELLIFITPRVVQLKQRNTSASLSSSAASPSAQ